MKKRAYLLLMFILSFLISSVYADTFYKPSKNHKNLAIGEYSWMNTCKIYHLGSLHLDKTTLKFISDEEFQRYFILKMRGFAKDIKITKKDTVGINHIYFSGELTQYSDSLKIYSGLIEIDIDPCGSTARPYRITSALAGSGEQIKNFIKRWLDFVTENLAEDYYYMQDLQPPEKKKNSGIQ
jgi:hypothetical protein